MQLFIRTLTGETITVEMEPSQTFADMKQMIFDQKKIPVDIQRIIVDGREIEDSTNEIGPYNLQKNTIIHLVLRKPQYQDQGSIAPAQAQPIIPQLTATAVSLAIPTNASSTQQTPASTQANSNAATMETSGDAGVLDRLCAYLKERLPEWIYNIVKPLIDMFASENINQHDNEMAP